MKNKLLNKQVLKYTGITLVVVLIGIFAITFFANAFQNPTTQSASISKVSSQILAQGSVGAQTQAVLNFQIGGKLTYLPFKEGDQIFQGATIASLDTYTMQKQLQLAVNAYQQAKNAANQTSEMQQAGVLEGQQRVTLDTTSKNGYSAITESSLIYDNVKRLVDNANIAQNSAQLNVDIANYALQLANLTSPINGILLRQDATSVGTNISPQTTFIVADPDSMVFSANVRQQDINFISVGNSAKVLLDGSSNWASGIVDKIYPQKITTPSGEDVYRVDIKLNTYQDSLKFGKSGTALIKSNFNQTVMLVPSWTVLSNNYIWVISNGKSMLKKIKIGDRIGSKTEVTGGLSEQDKVIENSQSLLYKLYQLL